MDQFWADSPPALTSEDLEERSSDGRYLAKYLPSDATWSPSEPVSSRLAIDPSACRLLTSYFLGPDAVKTGNMSVDSNPTYTNAVPDPEDFNPYLAFIGGGFFFFTVVHYLTSYVVPESAGATRKAQWKWRNVATSLVHSAVTGAWALIAFYRDPTMCDDMIYAFTHSAHVLVSFSIGYFLYDFFDMWLYNSKRSTYELLLHHTCVVVCFTIAAYTRMYLPYASLALVVEINSVFLHLRQLFIIQGYPAKNTLTYRNIALLNVATFVLFRILLLGWMTRWITVNRDLVPFVFFTAGSLGLAIIITMNAVLFYRILNKDFFTSHTSPKLTTTQTLLAEEKKNGFHPVTKDVQNMMKSLFDGEDVIGEEEMVALTKKSNKPAGLTKRKARKAD